MALTDAEIAKLLELVGRTREREIDCDRCLSRVAEFAELELAGRTLPEGLEAVAQHLSVCSECCEDYEALRAALESMDESTSSEGGGPK